jgi:hypothetical protein
MKQRDIYSVCGTKRATTMDQIEENARFKAAEYNIN